MLCEECGKQLENDSHFCSKCGASTLEEECEAISERNNIPILTLRPVFVPWLIILSILPIQLFMTIWSGIFFGGLGVLGLKMLGLKLPLWITFLLFAALAFLGIPFMAYYATKNTYSKTTYKFYSDRLEYYEGFWVLMKKNIKYNRITEISFRKGIFQKKYGLGTIVLSTLSRGNQDSGIIVADIENVEEAYDIVESLIE